MFDMKKEHLWIHVDTVSLAILAQTKFCRTYVQRGCHSSSHKAEAMLQQQLFCNL